MKINTRDRKIKLCDNIILIMEKYIQNKRNLCEAGGIIIGRENLNNDNLIIEYITEPMPKDKRTRYGYIRKDSGHVDYYNRLYNEHKKIYKYVGEWHTHPEDYPNYSLKDKKNWERIGKQIPNQSQYHIIVGIKSISIWEYEFQLNTISKICNIEWEELNEQNKKNY